MPYLQLDVNGHYPLADKKLLAAKMSETYAKMMSTDIRRISVAIRELGEGGFGEFQTFAFCDEQKAADFERYLKSGFSVQPPQGDDRVGPAVNQPNEKA